MSKKTFVEHLVKSFAAVRDYGRAGDHTRLAERGINLRRLAAQKKTTAAELLEADFGTSHPAGLDIRHKPDMPVHVKSMLDQLWARPLEIRNTLYELKSTNGYFHPLEPENVYLNPFKGFKPWYPSFEDLVSQGNTLMHETIHRLQNEERQGGWLSSIDDLHMRSVKELDPAVTFADKARRLKTEFNRSSMDRRTGISRYLMQEIEMQARLHSILAAGYISWQKMPVTKIELWAALHNLGVKTPSQIIEALRSTPEGKSALEKFKVGMPVKRSVTKYISEFNDVYKYAGMPQNQLKLWDMAFPAMYGNLLELYGDGPGRERMGLGLNPYPYRHVLGSLRRSLNFLDNNAIDDLVEQVPPQLASKLIYEIMMNNRDYGINPVSQKSPSTYTITRLVNRPDVMDVLHQEEGKGWSVLCAAVAIGHRTALHALLSAGLRLSDINRQSFACYVHSVVQQLSVLQQRQKSFLGKLFLECTASPELNSRVNSLRRSVHLLRAYDAEGLDMNVDIGATGKSRVVSLAALFDSFEQKAGIIQPVSMPQIYQLK